MHPSRSKWLWPGVVGLALAVRLWHVWSIHTEPYFRLKIGDAESLNFAIPSERLTSFLRNRDGFSYDKDHPNSGYRYMPPPKKKG